MIEAILLALLQVLCKMLELEQEGLKADVSIIALEQRVLQLGPYGRTARLRRLRQWRTRSACNTLRHNGSFSGLARSRASAMKPSSLASGVDGNEVCAEEQVSLARSSRVTERRPLCGSTLQ